MLSTVVPLLLVCFRTYALANPELQKHGCDDLTGSGLVIDSCGLCGGDGSSCNVVSGVFTHSLAKVGYHRILEIPQGAKRINVTEIIKSRNYLALRSRSGRSIVNGDWAIDHPGQYRGAGTLFTYRRPNEISSTVGESLLAQGPTNEILDLYIIFQQQNPGVRYEFILPVENHANPLHPYYNRPGDSESYSLERQESTLDPDEDAFKNGQNSLRNTALKPEYKWIETSTTSCSASCGRGVRRRVFSCIHSHEEVSELLCDEAHIPAPREHPCNTQACPAQWDIGEWSECSKTCGLGTQHRQVLCMQTNANRTMTVSPKFCRHLPVPESASTCQLKICSEWQIRTDWTPCSTPCGIGQRSREVVCVSNTGEVTSDEECNMSLRPTDVENCDMGPCTRSWFFTEWSNKCSDCSSGLRTRSVVCLRDYMSSLPLEGCGSQRPPEVHECNSNSCNSQAEWFTGQWTQCSSDCGPGSQQRAVVCILRSEEGLTVQPPPHCAESKPSSMQSCYHRACGSRWYHTDWSPCSRSCEVGIHVREVRCLTDDLHPSENCAEHLRPANQETCNNKPCLPQIDESCRDKYYNCNIVVQARLCMYDYYRTACCISCLTFAHGQTYRRGYR
ncbi:thrombospondin type-1 domain-containing protein 4-like [Xyrauchen texanus]|uniref:thrombospondin type-1 domain-containing protein 4-like n=1 Tax=Xyrauchen texanus TaxID=154827 RepID=UPI00224240E2|nr:thrombospondin type-1 domain-containing protein 4-like [Xyrauchen texanus]